MSLFSDINKVEILGNITADPEIRYTTSNVAVCSITIATSRDYKQNDEWKKEAEFHRVTLWGRLAEQAEERLHKGTRVLITGRLKTSKWEDKGGNTRYKTEIIADDMILIDRYNKKSGEGQANVDETFNDDPTPEAPSDDVHVDNIEDEDLPF